MVRCGGPNSGHCFVGEDGELKVLRQIPTGYIRPKTRLLIPSGGLIDLQVLKKELELLGLGPDRVGVDHRAMIIEDRDREAEARLGLRERLSSTLCGVGSAVSRRVLRGEDVVLAERAAKEAAWLTPYLVDAAVEINRGIDRSKKILVEGTQGFGLSLYHSEDVVVRQNAVSSIKEISPKPSEVTPALVEALRRDPDEAVRLGACLSLRAIGPDAAESVPQLIATISKDTSENVRIVAGVALDGIGPKAKSAVPILIRVLQTDTSGTVRASAVHALRAIGPEAKQAVPALTEALARDSVATVRMQAARSLGTLGFGTTTAVPSLIAAFENDKGKDVQTAAAESLVTIAEAARDAKRTDLIGQISEIQQVFASNSYPAHAKRIQTVLEVLQAIRSAPPLQHPALYTKLSEHPRITAVLCIYFVLGILWLGLLWIYPKSLWRINEIALFSRQVKLPDWVGGGTASLAQALIFGFFRYHPRVLDTWVSGHISAVISTFSQMVTVEERAVYIDAPVELEKKVVLNLKACRSKSPL